jgi:toxin-antitoxin system PIN domain toxin
MTTNRALVGLLDVNVLVALAWPTHIHHDRAHDWFAQKVTESWATCPATQAGFVRITSNPSFSPRATTPREALAQLEGMLARRGHVFWPDDRPFAGSKLIATERLVGHRQITDAHLLAIALRHGGILVTFDNGVLSIVPRSISPEKAVHVIGG